MTLARVAAVTLFGVYALTVAVTLAAAVTGRATSDDASILLALAFAVVGLPGRAPGAGQQRRLAAAGRGRGLRTPGPGADGVPDR